MIGQGVFLCDDIYCSPSPLYRLCNTVMFLIICLRRHCCKCMFDNDEAGSREDVPLLKMEYGDDRLHRRLQHLRKVST